MDYYSKSFCKAYVTLGAIYEGENENDKAIDEYKKAYDKMIYIKDKMNKREDD